MNLYTIGFTQKSAKTFFGLIQSYRIKILLDIRLNNKSQLAGFSKGDDLRFFLSEICDCVYQHSPEYAPTKDILGDYRKRKISWESYVDRYLELITLREDYLNFFDMYSKYENVCLLCSEPMVDQCQRKLTSEMIKATFPQEVNVIHI